MMLRNLLTVFVVGLFISIACMAGAAAMGGANWSRMGWKFDDKTERRLARDGNRVRLGSPTAEETKTLTWDGSSELQVNVPAKVSYTQGADARVTITGPGNWIEHVVLSEGRISFDRDHMDWSRNDSDRHITIVVQAPSVTRFELNGAQDMDIAAYDQPSLDLEINGAARIRAAGKATTMNVELNGASKANLEDVVNDDAVVELNGASSITLAPKVKSDIEINGVGKARVLSHPATTRQAIHGFGSITYGDAKDKSGEWDDEDKASVTPSPSPSPSPPKALKPATKALKAEKAV